MVPRLHYLLAVAVAAGLGFGIGISTIAAHRPTETAQWWQFQSVDTMKYSRDISREFLSKQPELQELANQQVHAISLTGATHVAIATPYDEEFMPILKIWVAAAREHGLKVWYRGNWSGWEGWFDYKKIDRATHLKQTEAFIRNHPELFIDGDVFTACPECENGGPGDPRMMNDAVGFRNFLIDEHTMMTRAFADINKNVIFNFNSMNGDVARLIMDKPTTAALGGVVTVDHYVGTPEKLVADIQALVKQSDGVVVLGEFGAPIPDIHGQYTEDQQADWIDRALAELVKLPEVKGISYWTNQGGSTALWTDAGEPKKAVATLTSYFNPPVIRGLVHSSNGKRLENARVQLGTRTTYTDAEGSFAIPTRDRSGVLLVSKDEYQAVSVGAKHFADGSVIELDEPDYTLMQHLRHWLAQFWQTMLQLVS